jgi:hypothetical protein
MEKRIESSNSVIYATQKLHESVKLSLDDFIVTSKFEVAANIIVITKAANSLHMPNIIPLKNIEEEQNTDRYTVQQIAKIMQFLRNIED